MGASAAVVFGAAQVVGYLVKEDVWAGYRRYF